MRPSTMGMGVGVIRITGLLSIVATFPFNLVKSNDWIYPNPLRFIKRKIDHSDSVT
jgi:hypothetical protein